jgi:hypothetical protein
MKHPHYQIFLFLVLSTLFSVNGTQTDSSDRSLTKSECDDRLYQFADEEWFTDTNNIITYKDCQVWDCVTGFTGRVCTEQCNSTPLSCVVGSRLMECEPPHQPKCVACRQEGREASEGGYSFGVYNSNNKPYELLYGRGSFEYAKLYPPLTAMTATMTSRPVVKEASLSTLKSWDDVMFPAKSWRSTWLASGNILLQYRPGDVETDTSSNEVSLVLQAPSATIKMCDISTQPYQEVPGLLYEFRYRQHMK